MSPHNPEKLPVRPIMQSSSGDNSNSSMSNPNQSTSESMSWDSRQKHPNDRARGFSTQKSRRRRVPKSVTNNACMNCKSARAKCDGKKPCTRCNTKVGALPCVYKAHVKNAKEELLKQIHELSEKGKMTRLILEALRPDDQTSSDVLRALRNGNSHESIAEWMGLGPIKGQEVLSHIDASHSREGSNHGDDGQQSDLPWTYVTRDSALLDQLFQAYFAWIHPVCTLFSERHFAESYKTQNHQHCSTLLVNAMCALACHFRNSSEDNDVEYDQLGIRFAEAFRADFDTTTDETITTIQAMAVMFLVDLVGGFGLRASSYLRLASEKIAEFSSTTLLHPLIGHGGLPSMLVEKVVWTHAQHALFLLERHYRARYTCRYQSVFQMFTISSICDFIIRFFPTKFTNDATIKDGPEAVALGLEVLEESYIAIPAAGAIREMLRRAAIGCPTRLPQSMDQLLAPPNTLHSTYSYADFIALCTRPSYRQPLWGVQERFGKGFAEDWCAKCPEYGLNSQ
ncbi:hypothetical protein O988_00018 [Pseudogymnoascus sp. VKM F-3808]|nr:hypothetical protein O988_00018 [Pseudogymnoascus sp. VKM F-3808]